MSLLGRRFTAQHLTGPRASSAPGAVETLLAVQSQDHHGAKWSLGQRVENATEASIQEAFDDGRILRTHLLRPTWHYVTPEDIGWLLRLTSPRVQRLNGTMYRQQELDAATLSRAADLIAEALRGHRYLTRAELGAKLTERGIPAEKMRLAYLVMNAELEGLICSGPMRGRQHTYALLEERAWGPRYLENDEALAEIAYRFFRGHGPATLEHLVWWSGLKVADARAGIAMARPRLGNEPINGEAYYFSPDADLVGDCSGAFLIPEYDEVLVGSRELPIRDNAPPADGWADTYLRPVLIDGDRVGTWKRTFAGRKALLEINRLGRLNGQQRRSLAAAAGRYSGFLQMPVELTGA